MTPLLRRWRRRCRDMATIICGLLLIAWIWSVWSQAQLELGRVAITLQSGGLDLDWQPTNSGVSLWMGRHSYPLRWWFARERWTFYTPYAATGGTICVVPLWLPFLLIAGPTVWLWYRDRRRAPGLCARCGYDLSGIASGVCPECGRRAG